MAVTLLEAAPGTLTVRPWPDAVIDSLGFDPRSPYVERFWLPVLGPSAVWLLRRIVDGFETEPAGFELDVVETARALGIGRRGGRNTTFLRTVVRCCQFRMAHHVEHNDSLQVRRKLPPLNRYQLSRLPEVLQLDHVRWQDNPRRAFDTDAAADEMRARAQRLALSLVELGEEAEAIERQLSRWRFHPAVCREATVWALARHAAAQAPTGGAPAASRAPASGQASTAGPTTG